MVRVAGFGGVEEKARLRDFQFARVMTALRKVASDAGPSPERWSDRQPLLVLGAGVIVCQL
jgi:hypothetical protein